MSDDTWSRLELSTRSEDVGEALRARAADASWLLGRQWQIGALRGEDAASPIRVTVGWSSEPVHTVQGRGDRPGTSAVDGSLEAAIEASALDAGDGSFRLAVQCGVDLVEAHPADRRAALRDELRAEYALPRPAVAGSAAERAWAALMVDRAFDGLAVLALASPPSGVEPGVFQRWQQRWRAAFAEGSASDAWHSPRMEHRFTAESAHTRLDAPEHVGGPVDWFTVDLGSSEPVAAEHERTLIPQPVAYRGMPASRWWELEDRRVHFGGLESAPSDPARLALAAFATHSGDDWYLFPLTVEPGHVLTLDSVRVVDSQGQPHELGPTVAGASGEVWRLFCHHGAGGEVLYIPAGAEQLGSAPIEAVRMLRDEVGNLAWAIEERLPGPLGGGVDVRCGTSAAAATPQWTLQLQELPRDGWIPLLPERQGPDGQMRLRRGRLHGAAPARARLLLPDEVLRLHEEELPVGGVALTRSWELARDRDGRPVVWLARRKLPGPDRAGRAPRFDTLRMPRA